jgi:CDP-diglyceride synthetase
MPTKTILAIVFGCVGGLLVILGIWKYYQYRKKKQGKTIGSYDSHPYNDGAA